MSLSTIRGSMRRVTSSFPLFRPGRRVHSKVRAVVQPEQIRLTLRRSQPSAIFITRLVVTSVFAYVVALWLPGVMRPVLAPLTALLVVEATLYQTVRSVWQRVTSVLVGVLVAVALTDGVGFTWWSLGLAMTAALVFGRVMRLGSHMLEAPISAMLILSLDTQIAAVDRVFETIVGAATGLLASFIVSPVRVQPAEKAIEELSGTIAGLLDHIAADLESPLDRGVVNGWGNRARALDKEIHRVEDALVHAEDSIRLRPRAPELLGTIVTLRNCLETLELVAVTIRGLTRSIADRPCGDRLLAPDTRTTLTIALREIASATRSYGRIVGADPTIEVEQLGPVLDRHVTEGRNQRARLAELLRSDSGQWPLHGELVVHLDRLLDELDHGHPMRAGNDVWSERHRWRRLEPSLPVPPPLRAPLATRMRRLAGRRGDGP
jgi:aromatic acid exporter family member 1